MTRILFLIWKRIDIFRLQIRRCTVPKGIAPELFRTFYRHSVQLGYPGDLFDTMCESYRNVSGLFNASEEIVRDEINDYMIDRARGYAYFNEYGIDVTNPFDGLSFGRGNPSDIRSIIQSRSAMPGVKQRSLPQMAFYLTS